MAEKQKMVKVKLPRVHKKQQPQFVSVNNYTCLIKPGEEVEVPDFGKAANDPDDLPF